MKKILCLAVLCIICSACEQYVITFNEVTVYEPPVLFNDYNVIDPALDKCLSETVANLEIHLPEQLTILRCTHGNIVRLDGLAMFTHIAVLDLSNNNLSDLTELSRLQHLTHLNLSNNPHLSCSWANKLASNIGQVVQPAHCNK